MNLYTTLADRAEHGIKSIALLIDPDKYSDEQLMHTMDAATNCNVSFILVGGSIINKSINDKVSFIKSHSQLPIFLFPGNLLQLCNLADGILFLSLISGRNPEFLIGNHVHAAPFLRNSGMEIIPTGYILIETGKKTSVEYISNTIPIPSDKVEIAVATALAGEMLGMKLIYLEGGSGAANTVNTHIISEVKSNIRIPLIVGGGIKTKIQAREILDAGADVIVIGNEVENNPGFLDELKGII